MVEEMLTHHRAEAVLVGLGFVQFSGFVWALVGKWVVFGHFWVN